MQNKLLPLSSGLSKSRRDWTTVLVSSSGRSLSHGDAAHNNSSNNLVALPQLVSLCRANGESRRQRDGRERQFHCRENGPCSIGGEGASKRSLTVMLTVGRRRRERESSTRLSRPTWFTNSQSILIKPLLPNPVCMLITFLKCRKVNQVSYTRKSIRLLILTN